MDDVSFGIALGLKRRADALVATVNAQNERIAELELALLIKTAHAEGAIAMMGGFRDSHPTSPMRADTGKRFKDGDIKRVAHLRYAAAFDAFLIERKIANPARYRAD